MLKTRSVVAMSLVVSAVTAAQAAPLDLPQLLRDVGLDVEGQRSGDPGGGAVWGTLPDGTRVEAHYTEHGVKDIEVRGHHATLPLKMVDRFVPGAAGSYPVLSHITRLTEIEQEDDGAVEVEGWTIDGTAVTAAFDRVGRLVAFERK